MTFDAPVYAYRDEFLYMVEAGIPANVALQAATIRAAEVLGVDDQGVIEAGKRADIVAVDEDVKITDGAFASLTGRIDGVDPERGKLKVSVSIFGRFTPVELEYWQVQRASE